ncbi:DNA damage-induced apoptosis suppressor protein [Dasypus novemcinctus]|uniref:DNA damage-induced apoptosis suppressor protein n=1 Tax=Dasypus novemcinctus TaxID=9361 RepID=UPI000328F340|nr:DNA damage-induced apoptosis suppressor protein [Dasypus novemcinctus]XP_058162043.1 DNA damage-induced apoptosis suppressor protein [Dasypus novemcinctus]
MNRRRKFLLASVLALQNSSFIYPSCQKCFSRIILVSKRSDCPKCGSTGEAENASYRYKLSLKVAELNKLFGITVFGSCLDTFFGLTATGLHRYIQDPNEILGTLDSDTKQNLLTKAVEMCFIGQSFIFGVTNFENQGGQGSESNNFIQRQCPDRKREVKALVACQIVLPDPAVACFTVIDYFHQLVQPSNFRKPYCGSQASSSSASALGHSDNDCSSSSCFLESHDRYSFSRFWQPSLELTSVVSQLTDDVSSAEQSRVFATLQQDKECDSFAKATSLHSCCDPIQDSWSLVSYMDKKSKEEKLDGELGLQAHQLSAFHNSHHESRVTDSNVCPLEMRKLLEPSSVKYFCSAEEIKNRYSQPELTCHQPHDVATLPSIPKKSAYPPSSLRLEEPAGGSQDCDPEVWDDLPLSESLNKFLAIIESEAAVTQADASSRKCYVDNGIDKLHVDHSRLSLTLQRTTGALHTPPKALRSSQTNSSKDNFLPSCEANPSSGTLKESQPGDTAEAVSVSSEGREISEHFLPNAHLSTLFSSSKDLQTARIQPHGPEISSRPNISESSHSCLTIKYLIGCEEKSLSEMSEKLTTLCSRKFNDVSDLGSFEKKQYYRWLKNQDDSFTVCRELIYPSEVLCNNPSTLKEMPYGPVNNKSAQNFSVGNEHEHNYNASADLFDVSAKEMDSATEITKKSQDILLQWETSLAESHPAKSDSSLCSLSENANLSSQKSSWQSISATVEPGTCSPPPHFQSDSEYDFVDSQDFVPYSQSTPVGRFHQKRTRGMKRAFKKLPVFYSDLDANYKKTRISCENDTQQPTPYCPKNKSPLSQRSIGPGLSNVTHTQPETLNHCPTAVCLETEVDEWVPPTIQKVFPSDMPGFQALGLRKCLAGCNSPDQKEVPRKKLKYDKQRTENCSIKELNLKNKLTAIVTKQKTLKYNCKSSDWISKESVSRPGSCSKVKCLPFSENWSSVPETESAWSPELFS